MWGIALTRGGREPGLSHLRRSPSPGVIQIGRGHEALEAQR